MREQYNQDAIPLREVVKDHETRIRSMEKTIWMAFGAYTIINSIMVLAIELWVNHPKG